MLFESPLWNPSPSLRWGQENCVVVTQLQKVLDKSKPISIPFPI